MAYDKDKDHAEEQANQEAEAHAQREQDQRAVAQEMAHQERMKETGGQDQSLDASAEVPEPEPSVPPAYDYPLPKAENIVDTTHWPEAMRQFMARLVDAGEKIQHEGQEYEVIMGVGEDKYLVADAMGNTKVITKEEEAQA